MDCQRPGSRDPGLFFLFRSINAALDGAGCERTARGCRRHCLSCLRSWDALNHCRRRLAAHRARSRHTGNLRPRRGLPVADSLRPPALRPALLVNNALLNRAGRSPCRPGRDFSPGLEGRALNWRCGSGGTLAWMRHVRWERRGLVPAACGTLRQSRLVGDY